MDDSGLAPTRTNRIPNADCPSSRRLWISFATGDPPRLHISVPFRSRPGLPGAGASVDCVRGNVVGRLLAESQEA